MERMKNVILCLLVALVCHATAIAQRVSGTVVDSLGRAIAKADVMELDKNHRVLNFTRTNKNGVFTMRVNNPDAAHIRISAWGYNTLSERTVPQQGLTFTLTEKTPSRLQQIEATRTKGKRRYVLTNKLLCGRSLAREVPWLVMLEHLCDTMYVLRLPIKAEALSGQYKENRMAIFEAKNQDIILQLYNGEDATPVEGNPNESATWNPFTEEVRTVMTQTGYGDLNDDATYYYYPAFIITSSQLRLLQEKALDFSRLMINNERANNYWIMYPMNNFAKELQRAVAKCKTQ